MLIAPVPQLPQSFGGVVAGPPTFFLSRGSRGADSLQTTEDGKRAISTETPEIGTATLTVRYPQDKIVDKPTVDAKRVASQKAPA